MSSQPSKRMLPAADDDDDDDERSDEEGNDADVIDKKLKLENLRLKQLKEKRLLAEEQRKIKEQEAIIEQWRTAQLHELAFIQGSKVEELRLQKQKRDDEEKRERSKRVKKSDNDKYVMILSSSLVEATDPNGYYNIFVKDNLYDFDIKASLITYNNVNDDMVNIFVQHFLRFKSDRDIPENKIQSAFNESIKDLFTTLNVCTSLNYLDTSKNSYLDNRAPDCTFTYKNININIADEYHCLQDFVICLGELKGSTSSTVMGIDDVIWVEQIARYLTFVLKVQNRDKIYGFLTNLDYIRFYRVEKKDSTYCNYYRSKVFDMFRMPPKPTSSSTNVIQPNPGPEERYLNKDTIKLFIKFLTMNASFYEYTMLNIRPDDDLLGGNYYIQSILGNGATSVTYRFIQNNYNQSPATSKVLALKISKHHDYEKIFKNEANILGQLKIVNNSNNIHLFYENFCPTQPTGNFIIFDTVLQKLESLTLTESKQLIDLIEYLYKYRIIHRDIRPQNVMLDRKSNHVNLIDFGFAASFQNTEETKELPLQGVISFGGLKFLEFCSKSYPSSTTYEYERTFDLPCAINLILFQTDDDVKEKLMSFKNLSLQERMVESYRYWADKKEKDQNYADVLNVINNSQGAPDFALIKNKIEKYFNPLH
ncbi:unnamed protein product [Rotaria magnacalcarata]|uniref:Protein kinase domain-containing protein n=4 Tax=Rotaria magnacalcarata TaxID=392030 RepID=A0A814PI83_9BILA|nr:unnamed protein product [Rotaria magnacalcarata]